ncbi:hypothetical protein AAHA92_13874 [Salvia divinorum]|uniref:Uncharacterized protein n=1 Tax=Salvia divinorum TaxID=28513 RepID=A0ABD1HDU9_SALDI
MCVYIYDHPSPYCAIVAPFIDRDPFSDHGVWIFLVKTTLGLRCDGEEHHTMELESEPCFMDSWSRQSQLVCLCPIPSPEGEGGTELANPSARREIVGDEIRKNLAKTLYIQKWGKMRLIDGIKR